MVLILALTPLRLLAVDPGRLADAIYHAEGGRKASVPYGIIGVRVNSAKEARAVCLRTIRNAWGEWDGSGDFIRFLARRYCPPETDPAGHRNWVRNTRHFYRKPKPVR